MIAIEARELRKRYGPIEAVRGVSFQVRKGETYAFLGPNGAGKTTTIGMLITLIKPDGGTAIVAGYDVVKEPREVRKRIGVVFQETTVDKDLTALENMVIHGMIHGLSYHEAKTKAIELLRMVGLEKFANTKVLKFSGGMVRRLEIVRALMSEPEVLFLDEPTIGLDPQSRRVVWNFINELKKRGITIFFTTHYMDEAEYADRIAIIDRGRIIAEGTPEELKRKIGKDLIYIETDEVEKVKHILQGYQIEIKGSRVIVKVKGAKEEVVKIIEMLLKEGVEIRSVEIKEPTLDDVFIELTGRSLRDEESSGWEVIGMMLRRMRI